MDVAKLLSAHYTCFVMDRRGRACSGVRLAAYSIAREYEDVAAALSVAGEDNRVLLPILELRSGCCKTPIVDSMEDRFFPGRLLSPSLTR